MDYPIYIQMLFTFCIYTPAVLKGLPPASVRCLIEGHLLHRDKRALEKPCFQGQRGDAFHLHSIHPKLHSERLNQTQNAIDKQTHLGLTQYSMLDEIFVRNFKLRYCSFDVTLWDMFVMGILNTGNIR